MKTVRRILKRIIHDRWEIGFVEGGLDAVMGQGPLRVNWLKHGFTDRWFADPFILEVTDDVIRVLVEEFDYRSRKGRISLLTVARSSYELRSKRTVLDLKTHLSFPAIWRENGKVFIYPESSASGALCLYELKGDGCDPESKTLLCQETMVDAIMTDRFGKRQLFSIKRYDKLRVYHFDEQKGQFVLSFEKPFSRATTRNAGDFFEYHGEVYRPAQVCDDHYGEAIEIQKVVCDGDENFCFIPFKTLYSNHKLLNYGMHTLNSLGDLAVVDVYGWNNALVVKSIKTLKKLCACHHSIR